MWAEVVNPGFALMPMHRDPGGFHIKVPRQRVQICCNCLQARDSSPAVAAILPRLWHQLYCANLLRNPNWHQPGGGTRSWLTDPNGAPAATNLFQCRGALHLPAFGDTFSGFVQSS